MPCLLSAQDSVQYAEIVVRSVASLKRRLTTCRHYVTMHQLASAQNIACSQRNVKSASERSLCPIVPLLSSMHDLRSQFRVSCTSLDGSINCKERSRSLCERFAVSICKQQFPRNMSCQARIERSRCASISTPLVARSFLRTRNPRSHALLDSIASSPYRDELAATFAAAGSVALVKSLETLSLTGMMDRVRTGCK
jgi:hypothetical protein